ncbi:MAG: bifunctional serine/threonine-protein kinase/formylglycine-generating enzyme family protein [Planctomycetota bacterium]
MTVPADPEPATGGSTSEPTPVAEPAPAAPAAAADRPGRDDDDDAMEVPSIVESIEVHPSSITTSPGKAAPGGDATLTHMQGGTDTGRSPGARGGTDVRPQFNQPGLGARLDIGTGGIDLGSGTGRTPSRRGSTRRGSKSPSKSPELGPGRKSQLPKSTSERSATSVASQLPTRDALADSSSQEPAYQPQTAELVSIAQDVGVGPLSLTQRGSAQKYHVVNEIARGGMGAVFRVIDSDIRRPIAMKVMIGDLSDRHRVMRFLEEVQVTGQLEHPGIPPVHDVGLDEAGNLFFTMKLVSGEPLSDIIRRLRKGRPYRGFNVLARRLQLFLRVCEAVAFAHSRGVIHRDIKPSNIMVGDYGEVQVMDWGLARLIGREARPAVGGAGEVLTDRREMGDDLTLDGTVAGTPTYMPPEQARGEIDALDERSDIWSLGALLYELLTFQPPVTGESHIHVLKKVIDGDIVPPRERAPALEIPRELEAIVMRAMTPRKAGRYRSVAQMQEEVQHFLDGETISHVRYSGWERVRKALRRNRAFVAGGLTVVVLALIVLGAVLPVIDQRHAKELDDARADGFARHESQQRERLDGLLEELQSRVKAWQTGATAHADAVTAWHLAEDAAPVDALPGAPELREMWQLRAAARLRALEALTARAAAIGLAQQSLSLSESLRLPAISTSVAATLSRLLLRSGLPEMDRDMLAQLEPAIDDGEGLRHDNGTAGSERFAPARLHVDARVPGAAGPVSVRLYRMVEADAYGAEPRLLPVPLRHAQSTSLPPDFLAPLIGKSLDAAFHHPWPPAPADAPGGTRGTPDAPADPARVGSLPIEDLALRPGVWVALLQWTDTDGKACELRVAIELPPGKRVYRVVEVPASIAPDANDAHVFVPGGSIDVRDIGPPGTSPRLISAVTGRPLQALIAWRDEVTVGEYRRFHPGFASGTDPSRPVVGITAARAELFAAWLTAKQTDGSVVRLPTASEWRALACATDAQRYVWGSQPESRFGWFTPQLLAQYSAEANANLMMDASPIGVRNLGGSLREWVRDGDTGYAIRGGSFRTGPRPLSAGDDAGADDAVDDVGFRLVRVLP